MTVPGRRVVVALGVLGALFALVLVAMFRYSRREFERNPKLESRRGSMRLVPLGKFKVGPEQMPVVWPAFYIDEDPQPGGRTWPEARVACAARGLRLPVPAEWEKAATEGYLRRNPEHWEWVEDPRKPFKGEVRRFGDRLQPPPTREEQWTGVRGGQVISGSRIYPARYSAPDLVFRCAQTPQ